MQPSLDAEALADRICNCCRMLCCPVLPRTPSGEPPEELALCGDHLDYLLEQSLLHGAREERGGFFGRGKMFDVLSLFIESSPAVSLTEYKEYTELAALARELAKTSPGRVRLFVRMLFNRGFYVTFIRSMHDSSEYIE